MIKPYFSTQKKTGKIPFLSINMLVLVMILSAIFILCYVIFSLFKQENFSRNINTQTLILLSINLFLILLPVIYTLWRVLNLFIFKHKREAVPYIKMRFVTLFSLAALIPAILVGLLLSVIFTWVFDYWFQGTVRQTLEDAQTIADTYIDESIEDIRSEMKAMTIDLGQAKSIFLRNKKIFIDFFGSQTVYRKLSSAYLLDHNNRIIVKAKSPNAPDFLIPSQSAFQRADSGKLSYIISKDQYLIWSLAKLDQYENLYLYTSRYVSKGILDYSTNIRKAVGAYQQVETKQFSLFSITILIYSQITLLILITASWFGITAANRLSAPIEKLVNATRQIRKGHYGTQIYTTKTKNEIDRLINAFNQMTRQLQNQHNALTNSHQIAENRRMVIETVLSGITAGVLSVNSDKKIVLVNQSACFLLNFNASFVTGSFIQKTLPEFYDFIIEAENKKHQVLEKEMIIGEKQDKKTLHVRLSVDKNRGIKNTYVITFDDITTLVIAQRHLAWQNVARKIAHEIKNPLTPILLSAERIKRKYSSEIKTDPDIFKNCLNTIIRHASNISHMITEFSAFAKTPKLDLQKTLISDLIEQAIFAEHMVYPHIDFEFNRDSSLYIDCDQRLILQILTNLLKNACESISEKLSNSQEFRGKIKITLLRLDQTCIIEVLDNGIGFPEKNIHQLVEPYVTTRTTGTGLGLAIVKRILDDHRGYLELVSVTESIHDGFETGALVKIHLPILKSQHARKPASLSQLTEKGVYYEI